MTKPIVHLRDIHQRPAPLAAWEKKRNSREVHWAVELFAEALGVFFYVYCGVGSTAGYVVGTILKVQLSSVFQIGFAYAFGIFFALGTCSATSGGHFNPCVTLSYVIFKGFPKMKALRYIVAQILGAYIACMVIYNQWKVLIVDAELTLMGADLYNTTQFTPNGPAGIFALYLLPGQTLGRAFLTESVCCTLLAIVIWASIDPTNFIIPPVVSPIFVSVAYATVIWGFATPNVSLNAARDVGARLMALTIWGKEAAGGRYAAIAALTNIPFTLLGVLIYETFLTDSDRVIPETTLEFMHVYSNHRRLRNGDRPDSGSDLHAHEINEKPSITTYENARS